MKRRTGWLVWALGNLLLVVGVPVYVAWDTQRTVAEEFRLGLRTTTDGDTIMIPVAEASLRVVLVLLVVHVLLVSYMAVRRRRSRPAA